ncbi:hypothetical protein Salat_0212900 [Sesamum alatum]|uniref:Uncharacterized protein n=1 Tax=Sesamum alatum TaxID=300844 RepID=A0AAE2CY48_9LAMI|nr:hypothetical protein Salat_0212900 [Sesamum alatum]
MVLWIPTRTHRMDPGSGGVNNKGSCRKTTIGWSDSAEQEHIRDEIPKQAGMSASTTSFSPEQPPKQAPAGEDIADGIGADGGRQELAWGRHGEALEDSVEFILSIDSGDNGGQEPEQGGS